MGFLEKLGQVLKETDGAPERQSAENRSSRRLHPGYAKIAAWVKTKYKDRITGTQEFQRGLELEQLSAEASAGLSAKVRKGFLDYLKKQNYEPLLK